MIGVFDSGLGGLGILKQIRLLLPREDIFYYADNKHAPYGKKTQSEIKKLTLNSLAYLQKKGCDIIVIACNTATTSGIDYYRKRINLPLIGVVPVIKTAVKLTANKKIALLATPFTIKSEYLNQLIRKFAKNYQVKKIACPEWVEAIENDTINDKLILKYLKKIDTEDVVVLGCTHFTLIKGSIQRLVGPKIKVIDSDEAVGRQILLVMQSNHLFKSKKIGKITFDCSSNKTEFMKLVKKYLS